MHGDRFQPRKELVLLTSHVALVINRIHETKGSLDGHQHAVFCQLVLLVLLLPTNDVQVLPVPLHVMYLEFSSLDLEVLLDPLQILLFVVGRHVQLLHQRIEIVDAGLVLLDLPGLHGGSSRTTVLFGGDLNHVRVLQRHYYWLILVEVHVSGVQYFDVAVRHVLLQSVLAAMVVLHCFAGSGHACKVLIVQLCLRSTYQGRHVSAAVVLEARGRDAALEAATYLVIDALVFVVESIQCLRSLGDVVLQVQILRLHELVRVVLVLGCVLHVDTDSLGLCAEILVLFLALHLHFIGDLHGVGDLVSSALVAFLAREQLLVVAKLFVPTVFHAKVVSLRTICQLIFLFHTEVLIYG